MVERLRDPWACGPRPTGLPPTTTEEPLATTGWDPMTGQYRDAKRDGLPATIERPLPTSGWNPITGVEDPDRDRQRLEDRLAALEAALMRSTADDRDRGDT